MPNIARVLPWLVLAFSLLALLLGVYEWTHPPFTDEQLKASLTDTWEVALSTTRVFAIVFLSLGLICVVLARKAETSTARLTAYLAATASLTTLLVFLLNHVHLAQRVSGVTGQDLGPLFGLF
jgi:hypothetical protein